MARPPRQRLKFTERNPVPIAVAGLVLIAVVLTLSASWQRLPMVDDSVTYRAVFSDAAGLVPGEEVRVAGVKVGTVKDLRLDGATVVAEFTVSGVPLGDRSEASIEVKTLLGQHYLDVIPVGTEPLPEDATIPLDRTRTPVNIVPAFNRLAGQTARTNTDQVAHAFDALATTLQRTAPEMQRTLTGLARLSRTVTSRDDQIAALFDKAEDVTGVVAARDRELGQLLTASDLVLDTLNRRRDTIRQIISGTRALAGQLEGLAEDNEKALGPVLRHLDGVLAVLRRNEADVEKMLTYAATYAREFTNVGGTGEWFDATLKIPRGFSVCSTGDSTDPTGGVLDSLLSAINEAENGSSQPCLPLGPAVSDRLTEALPVPGGPASSGGDR